jgi:hypothetical protein
LAEWLRSGLQSRLHRFDSGRRLSVERALDFARRERVLILVAVAFVLFHLIGFVHAQPRTFPDTATYEVTAGEPVLSADFLAGWRAPTLPLLYKFVTGDEARIWAQLAISIVCWLALAVAVAVTIRDRRLRPWAFAAVLLFALAPAVVLWDATLLSESVSISLTAAVVATWLWIVGRPSWWAYGAMVVLAAAWALARDPNGYMIVLIALALAVSTAISRNWGVARRMRLAATLALVGVAAVSYLSASVHFIRWGLPLQDLIAKRIAPESHQLAYFEDRGMPVTPELLAAMKADREGMAQLEHPPGYDSPQYLRDATPFHRWLLTDGRSTYTNFLLTHPGVVAEAFEHLGQTLLNPEIGGYKSAAAPWDAGVASAAVYPDRDLQMVAWLAVALSLGAFVAVRFGPRRDWTVPLFLIVTSLPFAFIVWHGEVLELDRHGLLPSIFLRLGVLLLVLLAADRWLEASGHAEARDA